MVRTEHRMELFWAANALTNPDDFTDYATAASSELRCDPPPTTEFTPGMSVRFSVHAKNAAHGPVSRGGDAFTINIATPRGNTVAATLTDADTGVYTAQPLVLEAGAYRCALTPSAMVCASLFAHCVQY